MSILNNIKINKDIINIVRNYLLPSYAIIEINKINCNSQLQECTIMIHSPLNYWNYSKGYKLTNHICVNKQRAWKLIQNI